MTAPDSIASCLSSLRGLLSPSHPHLDILVNNAGRNYTVPCLDLSIPEVQVTFDTNVFGVMRVTQAFMPLLIAAADVAAQQSRSSPPPRVVMIGSLAGVKPYVFGGAYNATKAALHAYSDTLRVEIEPFGVRVTTIVTGGVQSRIARTERHLPADSLYLPIEEHYQRRLTHSQEGAMPTKAYASSVVSHVLATRPKKWVWEGNKSWIAWFVSNWLPKGVWVNPSSLLLPRELLVGETTLTSNSQDIIFPRMFGLNYLRAVVNSRRRDAATKKA